MLEIVLTLIAVVVVGIFALVATSVFMAYITQAQYIDEHGFGDSDDD
jgi:Tfp pilus assembly protein PilE